MININGNRDVMQRDKGFTIVELLIVIVVIGVLATISIAVYANIQQKAKNTAIINAASQTVKAIQAYIATKGDYPIRGQVCVTITSGCANSSGVEVSASPAFNTAMATIATPPTSVPNTNTFGNGIYTSYSTNRRFNNEPRPMVLVYFLNGTYQQCGLNEIADSMSDTLASSTTGYTSGNFGDTKTLCVISIPGP